MASRKPSIRKTLEPVPQKDSGLESANPGFAVAPPVEPMLAKLADELPAGGGFLYEPKWDGFRAIIFRRGPSLFIQSRDLRPLDRYFPELHDSLLAALPADIVVDGEIVIATDHGLDFDALQLRLHPAASRVEKLAKASPSSFVAFDVLGLDGRDVRGEPLADRRRLLEQALQGTRPPIHLTPMTTDHDVAVDWLSRFEGAGLDGVIAKPARGKYVPGKREMIKVKHARTAECVVAGFRWHKEGQGTLVGSLLLGLRRHRQAAPCRRHLLVHDGEAEAARRGARAPSQERDEGSPVAGMGGCRGTRDDPHARRTESLERRQGPVMGTAEDRARLRGQVRPHAGGPLPSRGHLPSLAP